MEESSFQVKQVEFVKSATRPEHHPAERLPQVAFAGRSNVGKSSLLNILANRKQLARVSSTPGHTQLLNFFLVNGVMHFVDLPGYGYAKASKSVTKGWDKMISGFLKNSFNLKLVVALFDARHDLTANDRQLLQWLQDYAIPCLVVMTKADKLPRSHQMACLAKVKKEVARNKPVGIVLFSSTTRQGREEILEIIGKQAFPEEEFRPESD